MSLEQPSSHNSNVVTTQEAIPVLGNVPAYALDTTVLVQFLCELFGGAYEQFYISVRTMIAILKDHFS
jgi:hypothetical protein